MILLKNVLVATDFSEGSDAALTYGRALARNFGATLHVLHVADDLSTRAAGAGEYLMDYADAQREIEDGARQRIDALLSEEDHRLCGAKGVVVRSGTPAWAIVEYAKNGGIDLIVLGTQGRSGFSHLMMGSIAEHVVRSASCPVLAVKHPEHEFVVTEPVQIQAATSS